MRPAIGTPIRVRQSENAKELIASPTRFITRTTTAVQKPHGRRRHKPVAAAAHARQTVPIRTTPNLPNESNLHEREGLDPREHPWASRELAGSVLSARKRGHRREKRMRGRNSDWAALLLVHVTLDFPTPSVRGGSHGFDQPPEHALPIAAISFA